MKMKRFIIIILSVFALTFPLAAQLNLRNEISLYNVISLGEDLDLTYVQGAQNQLMISSSGYSNVKAEAAFDFTFDSLSLTDSVSLERLSVKSRFPSFTLTAGKTRLDWGEGIAFNAGNALFDDTTYQITFLEDSFISDYKWLTSVKVPVGFFSFVEAAVVAPSSADAADTTAGIRYYNSENDIKYEMALALRNDDSGKVITPSFSLSGNIIVDTYISAAFNLPYPEEILEEVKDSLVITAGAFHILTFENQSTLSMRLETLLYPFASFNAAEEPLALFAYPSIQYSLANSLTFSLQSVVSLIDASASVYAGSSWNIFDGLSLFAYLGGNLGEAEDTFPSSTEDSTVASLSVGLTSIF